MLKMMVRRLFILSLVLETTGCPRENDDCTGKETPSHIVDHMPENEIHVTQPSADNLGEVKGVEPACLSNQGSLKGENKSANSDSSTADTNSQRQGKNQDKPTACTSLVMKGGEIRSDLVIDNDKFRYLSLEDVSFQNIRVRKAAPDLIVQIKRSDGKFLDLSSLGSVSQLDLTNTKVEILDLHSSTVLGYTRLFGLIVRRNADLRETKIQGDLNANGLQVGDTLNLYKASFGGKAADESGRGDPLTWRTHAECTGRRFGLAARWDQCQQISFEGARITLLFARSARFASPTSFDGVQISTANLGDARFDSYVNFSGASIQRLVLNRATTWMPGSSPPVASENLACGRSVRLINAEIGSIDEADSNRVATLSLLDRGNYSRGALNAVIANLRKTGMYSAADAIDRAAICRQGPLSWAELPLRLPLGWYWCVVGGYLLLTSIWFKFRAGQIFQLEENPSAKLGETASNLSEIAKNLADAARNLDVTEAASATPSPDEAEPTAEKPLPDVASARARLQTEQKELAAQQAALARQQVAIAQKQAMARPLDAPASSAANKPRRNVTVWAIFLAIDSFLGPFIDLGLRKELKLQPTAWWFRVWIIAGWSILTTVLFVIGGRLR